MKWSALLIACVMGCMSEPAPSADEVVVSTPAPALQGDPVTPTRPSPPTDGNGLLTAPGQTQGNPVIPAKPANPKEDGGLARAGELESPSYFRCTDTQVCIGILACEDQGGILGGACGPGGKVCCSW